MRSPHYEQFTLSDLEWLIVPPLFVGQFAVLDATVANTTPCGLERSWLPCVLVALSLLIYG